MIEDIKNSILFHIPHSKTLIPDYTGFNKELVDHEISLLTDFRTDEIFYVENIDQLIFPYSRVFCDVERLPDDMEPMFKKGRGLYYIKTDMGKDLRNDDNKNKVVEIYNNYHKRLESIVDKKLSDNGFCTIVDCHSFPNTPFITDDFQTKDRPDICIGTNDFHTPKHLIDSIIHNCKKYNFSYLINYPYSQTIIPLKFLNTNENVHGVMIEINRKLIWKHSDISYLNQFINDIFN